MDRGLCFVPALLSSGLSPDSFSYRYGGSPVRFFSLAPSPVSLPGAALFSSLSRPDLGRNQAHPRSARPFWQCTALVGAQRARNDIDLSDCCHPQRHGRFSPIGPHDSPTNGAVRRRSGLLRRRVVIAEEERCLIEASPFGLTSGRVRGGRRRAPKSAGVARPRTGAPGTKNVTRRDGATADARAQVERERRV